jgi:segregation and condensation protein B
VTLDDPADPTGEAPPGEPGVGGSPASGLVEVAPAAGNGSGVGDPAPVVDGESGEVDTASGGSDAVEQATGSAAAEQGRADPSSETSGPVAAAGEGPAIWADGSTDGARAEAQPILDHAETAADHRASDELAASAPPEQPTGTDESLADADRLRGVVEAVLLVIDTPTTPIALAQGLGCAVANVEDALRTLRAEYDAGARGLDLREVADGWRLYTRDELAPYVERFVLDGHQARLTQASLETLAVVAYRQPVTRSRVSAIRGVNVDGVMRTLLSRGLIEECGADPETGGGLYRTTSFFLEKMGLKSLSDLPSLAPLLPDTSQLDDVGLST